MTSMGLRKLTVFAAVALVPLAVNGCSGSADNSEFGNADGTFARGDGSGNGTDPGNGSFGGDGGTGNGSTNGHCSPNLTGLVRDFAAYEGGKGHPDFEHYTGAGQKKMVEAALGSDRKPVYNANPDPPAKDGQATPPLVNGKHAFLTSPDSFHAWYRDVPGTNQTFEYVLPLKEEGSGIWTFANDHFFPIDGKGYGDQGLTDGEGRPHNFGFTFELHTEFIYKGGEVFTFIGDDDLWTFINGKLAVDLGGLHSKQTGSVKLDAIASSYGLVKGKTYPLDVFHAERHSEASNFRIDTTIEFTNCDAIIVR